MLGFFSAHIPWNAISNLELQQSYKVLRHSSVLQSASTLSEICGREDALTVDAIKKQVPSGNQISLAFDEWTSTNKVAITSGFAYNIDRNWASHEVQLTFDVVDRLFFSPFQCWLRAIGQGPTYWSKDSRTFEGPSWSFSAYQRPFGWNFDW